MYINLTPKSEHPEEDRDKAQKKIKGWAYTSLLTDDSFGEEISEGALEAMSRWSREAQIRIQHNVFATDLVNTENTVHFPIITEERAQWITWKLDSED